VPTLLEALDRLGLCPRGGHARVCGKYQYIVSEMRLEHGMLLHTSEDYQA
jgi:hypothetical protein